MKLYIIIINCWLFRHALAFHLTDQDSDLFTGHELLHRRGGSRIKNPAKSKTVVDKANSAVQAVGRYVKADSAAEVVGEFAASNRIPKTIGGTVGPLAHKVSGYVKGDPAAQMKAARPPKLLAEIRTQPQREGADFTGSLKIKTDDWSREMTGSLAKEVATKSYRKISASGKQVDPGRMEARVLGKNTQVKLTVPQGTQAHFWTDGPDGKKVRTTVDHTQSPFRYEPPQLPGGAQRRIGGVIEGAGGKVKVKAWNR